METLVLTTNQETEEPEETEKIPPDEYLWNNAEQAISELITHYNNTNHQLCQELSEVYNILENLNPTRI